VAKTLREGGFDECLSNMVDRINNRLQELYQEKKNAEIPTRYEREPVI
jgi:hypothetical protein